MRWSLLDAAGRGTGGIGLERHRPHDCRADRVRPDAGRRCANRWRGWCARIRAFRRISCRACRKRCASGAAAEQDRWYFAFASTWPDAARRFDNVRGASARDALVARYNHGSWHYINLPTYLQPSDRRRIDAPVPSMSAAAGVDEARMNVVQALDRLTRNWCSASEAERALALSWIEHLIADVHQPLHATALYADSALSRRGDRGGNDILVTGATPLRADNLHALWDGALG